MPRVRAGSPRREQVLAQAERMLKDPRARAATNVFYEQWFGVHELEHANKDAQLFPQFTPELMRVDAGRDRPLRQPRHLGGRRQAGHDAVGAVTRSSTRGWPPCTAFPRRAARASSRSSLNPAERAGIVTQASFLAGFSPAVETSPFKRGAWVRTRMLCQELPVPPNEVPPLPDPKDGVSNRQRAQEHTKDASCAACHKLIDGLGLGLEQYDVLGRVRTTDRGMPLDISGEVTDTSDINAKFNGGAELAKLLARSEQVRDCAPTQWLRYALARADAAEDACSLDQLKRSFANSGGSLRDMLLAVTQTDAFLHYRRPE